jgi:hypothetical protein
VTGGWWACGGSLYLFLSGELDFNPLRTPMPRPHSPCFVELTGDLHTSMPLNAEMPWGQAKQKLVMSQASWESVCPKKCWAVRLG